MSGRGDDRESMYECGDRPTWGRVARLTEENALLKIRARNIIAKSKNCSSIVGNLELDMLYIAIDEMNDLLSGVNGK